MTTPESDDEGFLNESEKEMKKKMVGYQQEQVQWMENGEKRNYNSIPLSVGPEQEEKTHATWITNPRFYAGIVLVVVAMIFVAICREAFISPPSLQEMSPGIVSEDASRHKHKTSFPSMFPTQAPFPTFLPTQAPFLTLIPTAAPSATMVPSMLPTTVTTPSMLPTEASTMVPSEDALHRKKSSSVEPSMLPTQTPPLPTMLPTEVPIPSMNPTEAPIPTTLPTEVPSLSTASLPTSPASVINHVIGGVAIVGLVLIGLLYGLYYWGWLGNKAGDDGYFVPLK